VNIIACSVDDQDVHVGGIGFLFDDRSEQVELAVAQGIAQGPQRFNNLWNIND
jgi:hypothetical protein